MQAQKPGTLVVSSSSDAEASELGETPSALDVWIS